MGMNGPRVGIMAGAVVALLAVLAGCAGRTNGPVERAATFTSFKGILAEKTTPGVYLARNADEWAALWRLVDEEPRVSLKEGEELGVGIFLGERPTAGYNVDVREVTAFEGAITVTYGEMAPPANVSVAQMLTAPFAILLIDAPAQQISVNGESDLPPPPPAPASMAPITVPSAESEPATP